jgi:3D-(3,5/4)-trihydroxycyclohexane-1,2-dione acylhydrolase (decyclizing)
VSSSASANPVTLTTPSALEDAVVWAKTTDRTTVISISTDPYQWTAGDAWWDVGVPQVSARPEVAAAYAEQVAGRQPQRYGV